MIPPFYFSTMSNSHHFAPADNDRTNPRMWFAVLRLTLSGLCEREFCEPVIIGVVNCGVIFPQVSMRLRDSFKIAAHNRKSFCFPIYQHFVTKLTHHLTAGNLFAVSSSLV